jgi:CRP-like cAMP-binding protein
MATSLESDADALRGIGFFEGLSPEHLRLIAASAESRSLPEKLLLYDEGQLLHSAYVIMSGFMRAERKGPDGAEPIRREIGAGVVLGERALILDTRASESVRVGSRARVLQIRRVTFRRLLQDQPAIAVALRARLSRTIVQAAREFSAAAGRIGAGLS